MITSIAVDTAGQDFAEPPAITITNPGGTGEGAEATAVLTSTQINFSTPSNQDVISVPNITGNIAVFEDGLHLTVPGNLNVAGNATIVGDITFGDMPTDTVTFVADVDSSIIPEVSGTYDLGSPTYP